MDPLRLQWGTFDFQHIPCGSRCHKFGNCSSPLRFVLLWYPLCTCRRRRSQACTWYFLWISSRGHLFHNTYQFDSQRSYYLGSCSCQCPMCRQRGPWLDRLICGIRASTSYIYKTNVRRRCNHNLGILLSRWGISFLLSWFSTSLLRMCHTTFVNYFII